MNALHILICRLARGIDTSAIELATGLCRLGLLGVCVLVLALSSGCTSAPHRDYAFLEARETSHPFAGRPFGPASEEDCARRFNAGLERQWDSGWYLEGAVGYKLKQCGFFGPRLTGDVAFGKRFGLSRVRP